MKRIVRVFLLMTLCWVPVLTAAAGDFPKGPITYVIPFNAGGQSDVEARLQQPQLEKMLGVPSGRVIPPGAATMRDIRATVAICRNAKV